MHIHKLKKIRKETINVLTASISQSKAYLPEITLLIFKLGMTQVTPNKHNSKSQNSLTVGQWRRRWPTYSPLDLHITPIRNYNHPFSKLQNL